MWRRVAPVSRRAAAWVLLIAVLVMAAFVVHDPTVGAAKSVDQALPAATAVVYGSPSSSPCGDALTCHHAVACPAAVEPSRKLPGQEIAADALAQDRTVGHLFVAGAAVRKSWDRSVGLVIAVLSVART